jgi:hypothetical protein
MESEINQIKSNQNPASYGTAVERPVRETGSNAIVKDTLYFRPMYQS